MGQPFRPVGQYEQGTVGGVLRTDAAPLPMV